MAELKPYLISEFKTGISTYLQPWIRPQDAFEPLVNAYVYRGVINKRNGFKVFGNQLADTNPVMGLMQYINQTTGKATLMAASTVNLYQYIPGSNTFVIVANTPPTFTGTISNFFNWTNWEPSAGSTSLLWMTNNKDPITTYNQLTDTANQPTITIDGAGDTITTALDVVVYKQRLLLVAPTLSNDGIQNQSIYWSAIQNPTAWRVDIAGQGGFLTAPTGDIIQSVEFLRDQLVVFFSNSTWIFRFTGNDTSPFRWDKVNNSKSTNSPYGSVDYDERCTSVGGTGLIACDGVNVNRYDLPIIDYYETQFSEQYYSQVFSERYDNLNQTWTLYVSNGTLNPVVGGTAPGSDSALIYNFLENNWATYTFPVPMTCLGKFFSQTGIRWQDLPQSWETTDVAWKSYSNQKLAPILLGGDVNGNVYWLDNEDAFTDNGATILPNITTTRWNPVLAAGQKTQFAYIDIYYSISSFEPTHSAQLTLSFFVDNSDNYALQRVLTLDGPVNSGYAFKRVYCNLIGEFIQMNIDPAIDESFQILGFILWAREAGRMTP